MPALLLITTVSSLSINTKKKVGRELEQTESKGQRASATSVNNEGLLGMRLSSRVNKALGDSGFLQECSLKKDNSSESLVGLESSTIQRSQPQWRPGQAVIMVKLW